MKRSLILRLAFAPAFVFFIASAVLAQEGNNTTIYSGQVTSTISAKSTAVQGAPYSATITNESVQTLADGNRIVQTSTGTTARDSQGRTRQDMVLPPSAISPPQTRRIWSSYTTRSPKCPTSSISPPPAR